MKLTITLDIHVPDTDHHADDPEWFAEMAAEEMKDYTGYAVDGSFPSQPATWSAEHANALHVKEAQPGCAECEEGRYNDAGEIEDHCDVCNEFESECTCNLPTPCMWCNRYVVLDYINGAMTWVDKTNTQAPELCDGCDSGLHMPEEIAAPRAGE